MIITGYDGTLEGLGALRWALENAAADEGVIVLSSVGRERGPLTLPALPGREDRARALLESLWMEDAEALDSEVELVVDPEAPAEAMARMAQERGARLVVVGHRRRGRAAALHVSVAGRLLDLAPCPVVVVA